MVDDHDKRLARLQSHLLAQGARRLAELVEDARAARKRGDTAAYGSLMRQLRKGLGRLSASRLSKRRAAPLPRAAAVEVAKQQMMLREAQAGLDLMKHDRLQNEIAI